MHCGSDISSQSLPELEKAFFSRMLTGPRHHLWISIAEIVLDLFHNLTVRLLAVSTMLLH